MARLLTAQGPSGWQGALVLTARESEHALAHQCVRPEIGRIGEGEEEAWAGEHGCAEEESPRSAVDLGACEERAYRTRMEEQMEALARELAAGTVLLPALGLRPLG